MHLIIFFFLQQIQSFSGLYLYRSDINQVVNNYFPDV